MGKRWDSGQLVIPGPIEDTEGIKRLAPTPDAVQTIVRSVPLGRMGTKQDVANLVLFLASPWAAYISGARLMALEPEWRGWSGPKYAIIIEHNVAYLMSAFGPKQTWPIALHMSAFGVKRTLKLLHKPN